MLRRVFSVGRRGACRVAARSYADLSSSRKTPLFGFHEEHQGKMVDFGGWALPLMYGKVGIVESVLHCRSEEGASLFDVSHMGQILFEGDDCAAFLNYATVADLPSMGEGDVAYTLLLNENGGIVDDCLVSNRGGFHYLVVNAATTDKDLAHLGALLEQYRERHPQHADVHMSLMSDKALIAVQGKGAEAILSPLVEPAGALEKLYFMQGAAVTLCGVPCLLTRCGYTGEDGFELSLPAADVADVCRQLMAHAGERLQLSGLGARDSLRLEAGLCLYGTDIDDNTTPVEASLNFAVSTAKRKASALAGKTLFVGRDIVQREFSKPSSVPRKRIGLVCQGAPARHGAAVYFGDRRIGEVTSGAFSPCLKKSISMAYVDRAALKDYKDGDLMHVEVRQKRYEARRSLMPFVPNSYRHAPEPPKTTTTAATAKKKTATASDSA